ncbi:class I SAM-dependent methyltransferase [Agromyces ramosus]|uniref:16S rRNA (Guanine1207-N2)-methyltransferase n=1 Tax=Agromyces ramosus TaxID=33879 RepID=A0ABU0RCC5_9MICO|nr:methyltransferase [Agromyces ramosus]MDQ0895716.1 16S rRNA (guanine1207-N2)-methyltransferase [Agromyces ramosus]
MGSDHYFSSSPASERNTRTIRAVLAGREVELTTAGGVFSPDHLDEGTHVLLDTVSPPPSTGNLLDLGTGWGPIAVSLALQSPDASVWAVDVNERALDLVRHNATRLGLHNVNAMLPDDVPAGLRFATIWSNPPIRVGKVELHAMLSRWLPLLDDGADAWLVVAKHLGAESLQRWLGDDLGLDVERAETSKGFRVLKARRPSA